MRPHIPRKIRIALGKKYLDWAASLPKFGGTFIRDLQTIREHQKTDAEDAYKRSRPTPGLEIDHLYFRLYEMFHLEEADRLHDNLIKLFPGLTDDLRSYYFSADFKRQAESLHGGSERNLGYIFRNKKDRFIGMDSWREIPELPEGIYYIHVWLHHILPSIFVVSLDVHLTDAVTKQLLSLQGRRYLPVIDMQVPVPWGTWKYGHSETSSDMVQREEILNWLDRLRGNVEKCLKPFLNGYFMHRASDRSARLPAVEVFSLKGVPEEREAFFNWTKEARWWGDSLGLDFIFNLYRDEGEMFIWPREHEPFERPTPAHRLILFWEPYTRTLDTSGFGDDVKLAAIDHSQYLLTALLPTVVITKLLESVQRDVEQLRKIAFESMNSRRRLVAYIKLNRNIQRASILLERFSVEFKQATTLVLHKMKGLEVLELVTFRTDDKETKNIKDITLKHIELRTNLIKEQLSQVRKSFSDFLSLQNMRATYRLQWLVIWLSIIATIAAIIGVIASWLSIRQSMK